MGIEGDGSEDGEGGGGISVLGVRKKRRGLAKGSK